MYISNVSLMYLLCTLNVQITCDVMYMQCTFLVRKTCGSGAVYEPPTAKRSKGCSLRAYVCKAATAFCRRRLVHCTNDRKSEGVRSMKLYNTLRTRQFPHLHNAVSSLIACEDTIMCKGGNGPARSVLHVSHYEGGKGLAGKRVSNKP